MQSTGTPGTPARFAVHLSSPIEPALREPPTTHGARARRKEPESATVSGVSGTGQGSSAWAMELYEAADDAEAPPERIAAVFEGAAESLKKGEAPSSDTPPPPRPAAPAAASSTPAADSGALLSPASVSMHSSELYKDMETREAAHDPPAEPTAAAPRRRSSGPEIGDARQSSGTVAGSPMAANSPSGSTTHGSIGEPPRFSMGQAADRKVAWRCGVCGYFVLAMDQNGSPLPFALSAFGDPLPLRCPRCQLEHTAWEQGVPFDSHGDHVNVRSTLSNNYVVGDDGGGGGKNTRAPATSTRGSAGTAPYPSASPALSAATARYEKTFQTNNTSLFRYNLLSSLAETHSEAPAPSQRLLHNSTANQRLNALSRLGLGINSDGEFNLLTSLPRTTPTHTMAYYCGLCNRRLLRVDAQGELVPMDCDDEGQVLPIVCPGCGELHNKWDVKPFAAWNGAPTGKRLY